MVAYVKPCHSTAMNVRHYIWFLMQIFKIWSTFNVNSHTNRADLWLSQTTWLCTAPHFGKPKAGCTRNTGFASKHML